jgi:hypothetical protein
VIKKYRSERKGRRSFDTAIEYGTVAMVAREKTRTAKSSVRASPLQTETVPRGEAFDTLAGVDSELRSLRWPRCHRVR